MCMCVYVCVKALMAFRGLWRIRLLRDSCRLNIFLGVTRDDQNGAITGRALVHTVVRFLNALNSLLPERVNMVECGIFAWTHHRVFLNLSANVMASSEIKHEGIDLAATKDSASEVLLIKQERQHLAELHFVGRNTDQTEVAISTESVC